MSYFLLHNHTDEGSNQRLIDTINRVEPLLQRGFDLGASGLAITDHESLSAHVTAENFMEKKRAEDSRWNNFKFIRGNEIYLCRNGLTKDNFERGKDYFYHFILLAKDARGHEQLRELSTIAYKRSFVRNNMLRPLNYFADLKQIIGNEKGHVIASSACLGSMIDKMLLSDEPEDKIHSFVEFLQKTFGMDNFFLELQPSKQKDQLIVNKKLLQLSKETGAKAIITTDSHMLCKEDLPLQRAFLNSKEDEGREVDEFYAAAYTMSEEEIHEYLDNNIGADVVNECLKNTCLIGNQIEEYSLKHPFKLPFMPLHKEKKEEMPEELKGNSSFEKFFFSPEESDRIFISRIISFMESGDEWFNRDFWFSKTNVERLSTELDYLWISSEKQNMRWTKYLLQMADYIEIIWRDGNTIIAPGRGSAVSETLNYMLGITQINPLAEKAPMKPWRFINPERASILDVDTDVESTHRNQVIEALQKQYGEFNVVRVMTKKTEASKSAILTSARGLGIDNEIASYIASMIVSDRGQQRSLKDTYYGNEEKGYASNSTFVSEINKYPKLWEMAQRIEGLVTGQSSHAGGIIIYENSVTETNSLMKLKSGDYVTAYDLHQSELLSDVKIDMLATEGLVRIRSCLDLLTEAGYIDKSLSLKERYMKVLGPYNINRDEPKMWEKLWRGEVVSCFQMEQESGIKGIKLIKPKSVEELAVLNSVIRLMASEKGAEQPLDMWARYRADINQWYNEMRRYGLKEEDVQWLAHHPAITQGMCESQESAMILVQEPKCGGNSLAWADRMRKGIAKKKPAELARIREEYYKNADEKHCDRKLVTYVLEKLISCQFGYSFNLSHCLSYSIVGLQEMNLAYFYPTIYWNTANLIVDSASFAENIGGEEEEDSEEEEENSDSYETDDYDGYDSIEILEQGNDSKKAKKTVDYGKISMAISRFKTYGINILPPDINVSNYTFTPDEKNNTINYGLRGITRIPDELIREIINNRPYLSVNDFKEKVKVNKLQLLNLIKSGAFDKVENRDREELLKEFIWSVCDTKQRLTLQNMAALINYDIIPEDMSFYAKLFLFNKFLKTCKNGIYYDLNESAINFISSNFNADLITDGKVIVQKTWDNLYKKAMDPMRVYLKEHSKMLLDNLNNAIFNKEWNKYCNGNISKFEMDSIGFYYHEHELASFAAEYDDFFSLPEEPVVEYQFNTSKGNTVPIYKTNLIIGTVVNKDKNHSTISLLTPTGLVNVKLYKQQWPVYDKQVSEKDENGVKHIKEKSWLTRGNLLMVQGIKRDGKFIPKKYKKSVYPIISKITGVDENNNLILQYERMEVES